MIRNYLKIALRNLRRNPLTSFINIAGLTIGLTCCLLILVYVLHELSYDRYNRNADRIYRVTRVFDSPTGAVAMQLGTVPAPMGPLLQNDFSDIQAVTRVLVGFGSMPMAYGEKRFDQEDAYFADSNLTKVFDVDVVAGDPATALRDPFSMMLSQDEARKYFGAGDPMNKVIRFNNRYDFKVTGVYKPFPDNAHMHPRVLLSFASLDDTTMFGENVRTNWGDNAFMTYLLLPGGYPVDKLEARFPAFIDQHLPASADLSGKGSKGTSLHLQKLTDIHLRSHLDSEAEQNGDISNVYIFGAVALFILLIACINYMNMATARSALRAREIGIRKTVGAGRRELMAQFLSESVLVACMAMVLALILTRALLPAMGRLSDRSLSMGALRGAWPALVTLPFAVGLLSGLYPALVLSGFRPVQVLKGLFRANTSDLSFRRVLVVLQFAISIALIVCTSIVFRQVRYMLSKPPGYDKDHLLVLRYQNELNNNFGAFRTALLEDNHILDATRSTRIPTGRLLDEEGTGGSDRPVDIKYVGADEHFLPTYGIALVAGRNFSRTYGADSANLILNESAVAAVGWKTPAEAVGKDLQYGGVDGQVIGVMKDIYFESMHQKISPMVLLDRDMGFKTVTVKVSGAGLSGALAHIKQTWGKFLPEKAFGYTFLDERFDSLYRAETRQGDIFTLFSGIAIFIACLGLFGLSAFTISQRVKEIGIRKVLGAGTAGIVRLISADFMRLVLVAALIAFPVAWYAMHRWLEGFAYHTPESWWIFALAGVLALLIAQATISVQTIRAASANPIKNLRSE